MTEQNQVHKSLFRYTLFKIGTVFLYY